MALESVLRGKLNAVASRPRTFALVAALCAVCWFVFGPPGGDSAAHLYQTQAWREHGWRFWDNFWYAGRYSQVNYSLLYYPLAAVFSHVVVIGASLGASAWAFARIVGRQWPRLAIWPSLAFALLAPLAVPAGTYPFMLGLALALSVIVALQSRHLGLAIGCALLAALAHPLALVFLIAILVAVGAVTRDWMSDWRMLVFAGGLALVTAGQVLMLRAFASDGAQYPFDPKDAAAITGFCVAGLALAWGRRELRILRAIFVAYGALAALAFLITSPIGGNVVRLLLVMGTPLLLIPIAARRFRPRSAVVAIVAATMCWQALPALAGLRTTQTARAQHESFWYPAIAFLDQHSDPNNRVEVVATADNWEAYYLARRGVPLARGWFRQDDWPSNAPLYGTLTPVKYQRWLRTMGIRYVLLPNDPLDESAKAEARLLESGTSGLRESARMGAWRIFELPRATPIATPRAEIEVLSLRSDGVTLRARTPGTFRLSLRYTPYWHVTRGRACVGPAAPWGTELRVGRPGIVRIRFDVRARTVVSAVLGDQGGCAPSGTGSAGRSAI